MTPETAQLIEKQALEIEELKILLTKIFDLLDTNFKAQFNGDFYGEIYKKVKSISNNSEQPQTL